MKVFYVDNIASHYRKSIYLMMDEVFSIDYLFGQQLGDIKQMDTTILKGKVEKTSTKKIFRHFYWQPGVIGKIWKQFDRYLLIGDIYALSTWALVFLACVIGKRSRLFFWTHGWYGKENWLQKIIKKTFLLLPKGGVFLYGNYARELMIKEGFNPDKLFVIHNSLDYEKQRKLRSKLTDKPIYKEHFANNFSNLFFVGRLTRVKQLDMVLQAMAQLREKGEFYNMTFIGDGEARGELETLVHELGLNKQVWFYGACYDEKILGEMIYNADLCVAPGNIGLTAMHTLVFGTPALTHNDYPHQMPEFEAIREGETGAFFTRNDVNSLVDSLSHWFQEKNGKREAVRRACMKEIDDSWTPDFQINVLKKGLKL